MTKKTRNRWDESTVLGGFLWGMLIGAVVAAWRLPRAIIEQRAQLAHPQALIARMRPADTLAESLAEGKALAEERRQSAMTP